MAFDPVPWFTGGGAEHSPEVARVLAYAATGGWEGVISGDSMKVQALPVPGTAVRIMPGPAVIRNRSVGGEFQSYVARNQTATQLDIQPTTSQGGRSDLIIARIEDPTLAGETWPAPADPKVGPYVHGRVIPNVPAGVTRVQHVPGHELSSAITLARIDIPPSTGTITQDMIVDQRELSRAQSTRVLRSATSPGDPGPGAKNALKTVWQTWVRWPDVARFEVWVPSWATHAIIRGSVESYAVKEGATTGRVRASFVGQQTPHSSFDENGGSGATPTYRNSIGFGGEVFIEKKYRGRANVLNFDGTQSERTGYLDADTYTNSLLDLTFVERIE